MPEYSSSILLGPSKKEGFASHAGVDAFLESAANGGVILPDVDPRIFEQWVNNIWELRVNERQTTIYEGASPPIPPDNFSDSRTWYRQGPDGARWEQDYPPPEYFKHSLFDAYELAFPRYIYEIPSGPVDIIATPPNVRFFAYNKKLYATIDPSGDGRQITDYTLERDQISTTTKYELPYSAGVTLKITISQTATVSKQFYTP